MLLLRGSCRAGHGPDVREARRHHPILLLEQVRAKREAGEKAAPHSMDRAIQAVEGKDMIERTFAMLKPDAVTRGLTGQVIARLEAEGLKVVAMKMLKVERQMAERLYEIHKGKPFYDGLVEYSMSGPVVAMILKGEGAVRRLRQVIGATDPAKAEPGTIRREFGLEVLKNVIHAADSPENAEREMQIFFEKSEILSYERSNKVKI